LKPDALEQKGNPVNKSTLILILEDSPADAELIERELRETKIPFTPRRVDSKEAFVNALTEFEPDVVLSDYSLPGFSGPEALRLLKERQIAAPFILVTGSLTDEVAAQCMKEGAHDYVLKTGLKRLPSAVLNALERAQTEREKLKAEAALHRSEELYRLITENTSDLICMLNWNGNYEYVSPSYKEVLGYDPQDLLGQSWFSLIHPEDWQEVDRKRTQSLTTGTPERVELRFKHREGSWKVFETVGNWIGDVQGGLQRAVLVSRDLTERKQAEKALRQSEEQLRQSQKLEAVGQLAGGVAHDFNNLLTVITGYSDILVRRLPENDPNRLGVEEIRRAAERASTLTRQLLAFSRKQVLQPKLFNLNTLVTDMGRMLRRLINEDIELVTKLTDDPTEINADPGQLEQVLMNLVVNARDALPDGGKITIETASLELDRNYADVHTSVQPGPYVMLAVSDNGVGMDAETRKHIFEPFFTTKEDGKGTGLGLSTVYGIVKQSGGNIWVYSEPSHGAVFKVYLPRVRPHKSPSTLEDDLQQAEAPGGNETILLIEDEPQIRRMAFELLGEQGYKILVASNGLEALKILEEDKTAVDLILTDVVMPEMNGRELVNRTALLRPDAKVLYMSGYTNDAIVRHGVLDSDTSFIQKPFSSYALACKVREVLDGGNRSSGLASL